MADYWLKQTIDGPLFEDILWSRPENKRSAGKLLVIGGSTFGLGAPAEAYNESVKAGAGSVRVLLPESVKKTAGQLLETVSYAPATSSGGFNRKAVTQWLEEALWADAVLVAGDIGRNSETAIALEQFAKDYSGPMCLAKDALDIFTAKPQNILDRPNTMLVLSFAQLQKIASSAGFLVTFDMDLVRLIEQLHNFSLKYPFIIVTKHLDQIIVSSRGKVSTTKLKTKLPVWRVKTAAHTVVWWLQNSNKPFEATTSSLVEIL